MKSVFSGTAHLIWIVRFVLSKESPRSALVSMHNRLYQSSFWTKNPHGAAPRALSYMIVAQDAPHCAGILRYKTGFSKSRHMSISNEDKIRREMYILFSSFLGTLSNERIKSLGHSVYFTSILGPLCPHYSVSTFVSPRKDGFRILLTINTDDLFNKLFLTTMWNVFLANAQYDPNVFFISKIQWRAFGFFSCIIWLRNSFLFQKWFLAFICVGCNRSFQYVFNDWRLIRTVPFSDFQWSFDGLWLAKNLLDSNNFKNVALSTIWCSFHFQ